MSLLTLLQLEESAGQGLIPSRALMLMHHDKDMWTQLLLSYHYDPNTYCYFCTGNSRASGGARVGLGD